MGWFTTIDVLGEAKPYSNLGLFLCVTLWLFNIAMENGTFIDGLPIKHGDFPWLC
jgi:hypothetical protein